jgi:phage repressor protein C with HTH and peptisase S24 domain
MFSRKADIGESILNLILENSPEINPEWLLTGNGEMLKNKATLVETQDIIKGIPLITYDAIAGFSSMDNDGAAEEDFARYIVPEFINKGVEFLIRVSGSSMYPKYSSGDILACKFIKDRLFFQWGKIYVIDSSQGILVKRVRKHEKYPEYIILESDNKERYQPFEFPTSDIRSLSIVIGVIRLE